MTYAIFYDLETTSKFPIGQILNYCFTLVGADYEVVAELAGLIRISPLELPTPGAIAANRTDVLKHQALAQDTEAEAAHKIAAFIDDAIDRAGSERVQFVGYNSSKFDLMYLRTTLIRNGINPYFEQRLIYRDMLHGIRKLSAEQPVFPRLPGKHRSGRVTEPRMSLALEVLANAFALTSERQKHESRADVQLSIDLARHIQKNFGLDVRTYDAFEPLAALGRSITLGTTLTRRAPQYDLSNAQIAQHEPIVLHDFNAKYSLWIDLAAYRRTPDRSAIRWKNHSVAGLVLAREPAVAPDDLTAGRAAHAALKGVNLKNFFTRSTCDIEQDIYRLDFRMIEALAAATAEPSSEQAQELKELKCRDLEVIFARFRLREWERIGVAASATEQKRVSEILQKYGAHRYGGGLKMQKFVREEDEEFPENHPTTADLEAERLCLLSASLHDSELNAILESLGRFYRSQPVWIEPDGANLPDRVPGVAVA